MTNIELEVKNDILIIKVDLKQRQGKSKSGKTEIIASSEGNIKVPGHENIKFGLNVYEK